MTEIINRLGALALAEAKASSRQGFMPGQDRDYAVACYADASRRQHVTVGEWTAPLVQREAVADAFERLAKAAGLSRVDVAKHVRSMPLIYGVINADAPHEAPALSW